MSVGYVPWAHRPFGPFDINQHPGSKGGGILSQFCWILGADAEAGLRDGAFEAGDDVFLQ
jgi:hypothetical protein